MDQFHNISGLAVEISAGLIVTALLGCMIGWSWGKAVGAERTKDNPAPGGTTE